jgi:energy-coupling factor transport system permease protein
VRPAIAYRHRPGPLGDGSAAAASAYIGALGLAALVISSPLGIASAGAGVIVAGLAGGAARALRLALRWSLWLGLLLVVVNAFASQRGDTVLVNGIHIPPLGTFDITLEALAAGAVQALRLGVVIAAFAVHAATVDPDRVLRLLRPIAARSALTATVIARLVPLAAADYARLADASALRGPAAASASRAQIARRLVAGSLDRAVDVAATLELRGYAYGAPRRAETATRSRHDLALWIAAAAIAATAIVMAAAGLAGFDAYPRLRLDAGPAPIGLALALPALATIPFAADAWSTRRG